MPRREQRQAGVVRGAQLVAVDDAVHVSDGRPRAREAVLHLLERHDQRVPGVGTGSEQARELRAILIEHLANRRFDVFDANGRERRQVVLTNLDLAVHLAVVLSS